MATLLKPQIINVMLSSIDGKIAFHSKEPTEERRKSGFTNRDDFIHLKKVVSTCDAVFIGFNSIEVEQGAFSVANIKKNKKEPHWFVIAQNEKKVFESPFWLQDKIQKTLVIINEDINEIRISNKIKNQNTEFIFSNLNIFLNYLVANKYKKIALLGGGKLNTFFWEKNLVSDLYLTISPFIVATLNAPNIFHTKSNKPSFLSKLTLKSVTQKGSFIFSHYRK